MRAYAGGIAEWTAGGGPLERGPGADGGRSARSLAAGERDAASAVAEPGVGIRRAPVPARSGGAAAPNGRRPFAPMRRPADRILAGLDALAGLSVGQLLSAWMGMALVFGIVFWIAGLAGAGSLIEAGRPEPMSIQGVLASLYFSFITAMSVGYGDIVPLGPLRVLAIAEAAAGLLLFGFIIARFVSRRQEQVTDEIHRIAFEDRLGRVQTGLHLVLSEMQAIADACSGAAEPPPRMLARAESAAMVFARELRTVHDLLYRPQQVPDEEVFEAIFVTLAAAFRELNALARCLTAGTARGAPLQRSVAGIARLGSEICGECVPREFAPGLKEWMDQIQEEARRLPGAAGA